MVVVSRASAIGMFSDASPAYLNKFDVVDEIAGAGAAKRAGRG
jgi:hypothetical protein